MPIAQEVPTLRWVSVFKAAELAGYTPDERGRVSLLKQVRKYDSAFPNDPPILRRRGYVELNSLEAAMRLLYGTRPQTRKKKSSEKAVHAAKRSDSKRQTAQP